MLLAIPIGKSEEHSSNFDRGRTRSEFNALNRGRVLQRKACSRVGATTAGFSTDLSGGGCDASPPSYFGEIWRWHKKPIHAPTRFFRFHPIPSKEGHSIAQKKAAFWFSSEVPPTTDVRPLCSDSTYILYKIPCLKPSWSRKDEIYGKGDPASLPWKQERVEWSGVGSVWPGMPWTTKKDRLGFGYRAPNIRIQASNVRWK